MRRMSKVLCVSVDFSSFCFSHFFAFRLSRYDTHDTDSADTLLWGISQSFAFAALFLVFSYVSSQQHAAKASQNTQKSWSCECVHLLLFTISRNSIEKHFIVFHFVFGIFWIDYLPNSSSTSSDVATRQTRNCNSIRFRCDFMVAFCITRKVVKKKVATGELIWFIEFSESPTHKLHVITSEWGLHSEEKSCHGKLKVEWKSQCCREIWRREE